MLDFDFNMDGTMERGATFDSFLQLDGRARSETYRSTTNDFKLNLEEIAFSDFSYMSQRINITKPCQVDIRHEGNAPYITLNAVLSGTVNKWISSDDYWGAGDMNISIVSGDYSSTWDFSTTGVTRQQAVVLPLPFLERLGKRFPEVFVPIVDMLKQGDVRKLSDVNARVDRGALRLFADIEQSYIMGSAASDYAEQRIMDYISPYIYKLAGVNPEGKSSFRLRNMMHDARDIVEARLANPPSLHELATEVGTNECTLKKEFRAEFGLTVFGLIYKIRMERAADMLRLGGVPMTDIAQSLGYDHMSHFSTAFRRFYGVPPTLFRQTDNARPTCAAS